MRNLQKGDKIRLLRKDHSAFKPGEVLTFVEYAEKRDNVFDIGWFQSDRTGKQSYVTLSDGSNGGPVDYEVLDGKVKEPPAKKVKSTQERRKWSVEPKEGVNGDMERLHSTVDLITQIKHMDREIKEAVKRRSELVVQLASVAEAELGPLGLKVSAEDIAPKAVLVDPSAEDGVAVHPERRVTDTPRTFRQEKDMEDPLNWRQSDVLKSRVNHPDNPSLVKGKTYRLRTDPERRGNTYVGAIVDQEGQVVYADLTLFDWVS